MHQKELMKSTIKKNHEKSKTISLPCLLCKATHEKEMEFKEYWYNNENFYVHVISDAECKSK